MKSKKLNFLRRLVDDANSHVREYGVAVELCQEEDEHVKVRLFEPKPGDLDPADNNVLAEVSLVTLEGLPFLLLLFTEADKVWVSAMNQVNASISLAGLLLIRH